MRSLRRPGKLLVRLMAWLAVGLTTMAGCVPVGSTAPLPPFAVLMNGDDVEIRYTACERTRISQVTVTHPRHAWLEDTDPVLWAVAFDPPIMLRSVIVGVPDR